MFFIVKNQLLETLHYLLNRLCTQKNLFEALPTIAAFVTTL